MGFPTARWPGVGADESGYVGGARGPALLYSLIPGRVKASGKPPLKMPQGELSGVYRQKEAVEAENEFL